MKRIIAVIAGVALGIAGLSAPASAGSAPIRTNPDGVKVEVASKPLATVPGTKTKPPRPGASAKSALSADGRTHYYAGLFQYPANVSGVGLPDQMGAQFNIVSPAISTGGHTLSEIAAEDDDGQQTVEIGFRKLSGDTNPKLFVFHWIDGVPQGYSTGFVPVTGACWAPGNTLTPTTTANRYRFAIAYFDSVWWLGISCLTTDTSPSWIGYIPGSRWASASEQFTRIGLGQSFGEVAAAPTEVPPCAQMGNGQFGRNTATPPVTNTAAAYMNSFSFYDTGTYRTTVGSKNEPTPNYYRWGFQSGSTRSGYYGGDPTTAC